MISLIVTPKSNKELQLIKALLDSMRVSSFELSNGEKEDLGMSLLMQKVDRTKKVSRQTIMKKLK